MISIADFNFRKTLLDNFFIQKSKALFVHNLNS